jgi:hypothetical protein
MRNLFKGRRRWLALSLASLLIASVAAAVVIATARINNNQVVSPTITAEQFIGVAFQPNAADCSDFSYYQESYPFALLSGLELDYSDPANTPLLDSVADAGAYLCMGNTSSSTSFTWGMRTENVSSFELGACDPDEVAAGDTTCLSGDPGELAGAVTLVVSGEDGTAAWCLPTASFGVDIENGPGSSFGQTTGPGDWCAFRVELWDATPGPPDPIYSSDSLLFDIVFTADDGTP